MATRNEKLVTDQVKDQDALADRSVALAALLISLMDESEPALRSILERYLTLLKQPGVDLSSPAVQQQLANFRQEVIFLRARQLQLVESRLDEESTAEIQAQWNRLGEAYSAIGLAVKKPDGSTIPAILSTAFLGRDLTTWMSDLAAADANRISDALTIGLIRDESRTDILRATLGDQALDGGNGATEVTRRSLRSITDVALFAAVSQAKKDFEQENSDLFPKVLYVAVLDDRTTPICRSLNGRIFNAGEGPIPPLHWNCRSTRIALPADGGIPEIG